MIPNGSHSGMALNARSPLISRERHLKARWLSLRVRMEWFVFAHGSGSSRHSPRNRSVAEHLNANRIGTLLFDLLTREEESIDPGELRFDIPFLAKRLVETLGFPCLRSWLASRPRGIRRALPNCLLLCLPFAASGNSQSVRLQ
jgi:hypothetical protein